MQSTRRGNLAAWLRGLSWRRVVAGIFTVVLFGYLAYSLATNWQALLEYDWQIDARYLAASLGAYIASLLLAAAAWHGIVASMEPHVPWRKGVAFFIQSNLSKRLPGLIWYALSRFYLYEQVGVSKVTVSVGLVIELVALIMGGIVAYLATGWSVAGQPAALTGWWLIVPLGLLILLLLRPQAIYQVVNRIVSRRGTPLPVQHAGRLELVVWSLLLAGGWASGGLFLYFLIAGVYPDLDPSSAVAVVNSWTTAGLIALATLVVPLGLGLKEVSLAYLLSFLMPWPVAVLISLLARLCGIIGDCVALLLSYVFL